MIAQSPIASFTFQEHHSVRVTVIDNEPWFCLPDVCAVLEIKNSRQVALNQLDEKGVCKKYTLTQGGEQATNFINEPNLYRVIFRSNKQEARAFQDWVFNEVLPSIRKTGSYVHPQATPTTTNAQEIVDTFHCLLRLAHTCGFENNQALLSADSGTKKLVGTSALALIEATHLHADQRGRTYTPTELGRMLPIRESGKAFNRKLNLCGLQERDDAGCWIPTVKAQGLYEWFDTGKRHSDGVPVKQLKWFVSVLDAAKYSWQRAA